MASGLRGLSCWYLQTQKGKHTSVIRVLPESGLHCPTWSVFHYGISKESKLYDGWVFP